MIQRIQSVYLFLAFVVLVVAMCLPVGQFVGADNLTVCIFKLLGVSIEGEFQSTWGLFGILLLGALITLGTIFLFRNRMLQVRMTIFSSLLLVGFYVVLGAFWYVLSSRLEGYTFQPRWALCLPLVAMIFNYLAFRGIYSDELMVKAADRLRS